MSDRESALALMGALLTAAEDLLASAHGGGASIVVSAVKTQALKIAVVQFRDFADAARSARDADRG